MSTSTRWTVAALVVVVALGVGLWTQLRPRRLRRADPARRLPGSTATPTLPRRWPNRGRAADLAPCPADGAGAGPPKLRGITVECAADGADVDVAKALAGRTVVLNLWAYWCAPCAEELPAMAEYQRRVGPAVSVVTVHQDENETAALLRLAELGVRLPTLQDGRRLIAAALQVPNVMPATVVLRPDGSVAEILPRSFASADDIAAAVDPQIGVPG